MYTTVLIVILVTGSLLYFRHRWRQYGERYRLCIAPENHLQALEDILLGEHDYSDQFIEQVGRELDAS
jgi:hypothetical protein